MKSDRRDFLKAAGIAGAGLFASGQFGNARALAANDNRGPSKSPSFSTELFLDNEVLEATPGVARRLHPPTKHPLNPIIRCERWCDGTIIQPYTTMYDSDDRLFKMWARCGSDAKTGYLDGNAAYMLYFTSKDGLHWEKPDLGVTSIGGRRDHNIVFTSDIVLTSVASSELGRNKFVVPSKPQVPQGKKAFFWSVNKHPHPPSDNERFVATAIVQDHRRGAHIVTSPDGIHWSCASAPYWQTPHDVSGNGDDCLMHLMYDHAKQKWVLYRRIVPDFSERMIADESDRDRSPVDRYYRSYAYAESDDLVKWTGHRYILSMDADDAPDTELYQFGCHKIGSSYVGYMSVFYLRDPQTIDVQLATSRDGINFTRVCRREPFIPAGPLGYYDVMAMACSQPEPVIVDNTMYIYYAACNFPHNADVDHTEPGVIQCGAALATLKRDRFASLETSRLDQGPCRVVTKPFVVQNRKLYLNAATWSQGTIRVEALTRDWHPIAGFTEPQARSIQGDALDHAVSWNENADLAKLLGQEIRLKFYMTRARMYAMTLADEARQQNAVAPEFRYDKQTDSAPTLN